VQLASNGTSRAGGFQTRMMRSQRYAEAFPVGIGFVRDGEMWSVKVNLDACGLCALHE
jgi:hypothetical protein